MPVIIKMASMRILLLLWILAISCGANGFSLNFWDSNAASLEPHVRTVRKIPSKIFEVSDEDEIPNSVLRVRNFTQNFITHLRNFLPGVVDVVSHENAQYVDIIRSIIDTGLYSGTCPSGPSNEDYWIWLGEYFQKGVSQSMRGYHRPSTEKTKEWVNQLVRMNLALCNVHPLLLSLRGQKLDVQLKKIAKYVATNKDGAHVVAAHEAAIAMADHYEKTLMDAPTMTKISRDLAGRYAVTNWPQTIESALKALRVLDDISGVVLNSGCDWHPEITSPKPLPKKNVLSASNNKQRHYN